MTPAFCASAPRPLSRRARRTSPALGPLALAAGLLLAAGMAPQEALAQTSQTRVTEFSYDPNTGLLVQQVSEPDDPAIALTTTYSYDGFGNQLTSTVSGPDIATRTTSATYTADGRFTASVTNALGHSETRVTDGRFGNVTGLTGPNGLATTWEYDGFGRKTREVRADGTETRWTYDLCTTQCPAGAVYLVSAQDFTTSSGTATTAKAVEYLDKLNRVFRSEGEGFDGTPVYADTLFNARGEVTQVSKPYFTGTAAQDILWSTFAYDTVGRRTSVTLPDGGVESTAFSGLTTTLTNALSQTSVRVENALGELVSATDNLGNVTTYSYDAFGSLLSTNAEGVVTTMSYDVRGLKTAMDDPDMGVWSYSYNALGELVSQTDAKAQTATMAYDTLGRMVSRNEAEGTTTWTYDSAAQGIGKIASVAAPHINYAEAMAYDSVGRPATTSLTVDGETYDTTTLYDAAGRPDTLVYPSGFQVRSHFTAKGHLSSVTDDLATTTYWQATQVNAEGQVTAETLGNGVTTARVYDPATSRIDSILTTSGTGTIQDLAFDFDTLGNLTARRDLRQDREEAFTYDGLNRLTGTTLTETATLATLATTNYSYDALGNLLTKSDVAGTYVYGEGGAGPHAVSQIGSALYSYDANGAMVSGDGKTTAWTSFNKPREIVDTLTGNESWFVYGPSRARVKQQIMDGGLTTNVVYVGSHFEVKTRPGEDDELTHYIRAGGSVVAIYTRYDDGYSFTDKTRYLHRDHLGSVAAVTDETGQVTERFSYDPHGKRRLTDWQAGTPASPAETPRGFTGHEHLDAVGLIHMNGRVYDPTLGRFLSADPFVQYPETTQGFNRYAYVNNNPLSYTDPSGFWEDDDFSKNGHNDPGAPGGSGFGGYDGPDGSTHKDRMESGPWGTGQAASGYGAGAPRESQQSHSSVKPKTGILGAIARLDEILSGLLGVNSQRRDFHREHGGDWHTAMDAYDAIQEDKARAAAQAAAQSSFFGFEEYPEFDPVPTMFTEVDYYFESAPELPYWETVIVGTLSTYVGIDPHTYTVVENGMRVRVTAQMPSAVGFGVPGGYVNMTEVAIDNVTIVGDKVFSRNFTIGVSTPEVTEFIVQDLPENRLSLPDQIRPGSLSVRIDVGSFPTGVGAGVKVDIYRDEPNNWF